MPPNSFLFLFICSESVQGDTGHAEARMVTDTYAHGFDADRKLIAQEMDSG